MWHKTSNELFEEPPPAYSPPQVGSRLSQASHSDEEKVCYNFAALTLEPNVSPPSHPRTLQTRPQESPVVMEQLLRLTSNFVRQVQAKYPEIRHGLPGGKLTAMLHLAPDEAVPASAGWHLTQTSQLDDLRRGQAISVARVRASKIKKDSGTDDKQGEKTAGGLHDDSRPAEEPLFSFGDLAAWMPFRDTVAVESTREMLWWNDEDRAQRLLQNLTIRIHELQSEGAHKLDLEDRPGGNHKTPDSAPLELMQLRLTAEETTFRRSNMMGLWESQSGWTIVAKVTVSPGL